MSLPMKLAVAVPTACLYEMDGGMELIEFYEQHVPERAVKPVNLKCEEWIRRLFSPDLDSKSDTVTGIQGLDSTIVTITLA